MRSERPCSFSSRLALARQRQAALKAPVLAAPWENKRSTPDYSVVSCNYLSSHARTIPNLPAGKVAMEEVKKKAPVKGGKKGR